MQHVINKQVIEFSLRERETAFRLQQQLSTQFYQQVLPVLERVFDVLGPEGELVSLDRLVIDVGAVAVEQIEDGSWTDELYPTIMAQAEALIRESGGRGKAVRRPIGAGLVEQWLMYMRTGRLPWNVTGIDAAWLVEMLGHLAADHGAVSVVRETFARELVVLRRVVEQHDEAFLVSLTEVLTARSQAELPIALAELGMVVRMVEMSPGAPGIAAPSSELVVAEIRRLWMGALRLAAAAGVTRSSVEIVKILLEMVVTAPVSAAVVFEQLVGRIPFCEPLLKSIAQHGGVMADMELRDGQGEIRDREVSVRVLERLSARGDDEVDVAGAGFDREIAEGIFVPYAGLVLLHPFLSAFFSRLGLVADYVFVDEAARERCLHLLQYLATGTSDMPEYELVMAKVLCEFPLETPVVRAFEPTEAEMEEVGGVLDACLGQWTELNNTSREGLRGSFLNRAGKLYKKDGRLRLEVERSSIDVLLDYLPWNLSLVKLPWMREMLYVNWR